MTQANDDRTWYDFPEKLISIGCALGNDAELPITEKVVADVKVVASFS
jgi:hypothetical protein